VLPTKGGGARQWKIAGRGQMGVIAVYAALFEPRFAAIVAVNPPASHREGPVFPNVLRVLDIPEAFGLLAPRPLTILASQSPGFDITASIYRVAGGTFKMKPFP